MSAIPADTMERVAKLVPLLSSDKAGEVAATAAAIGRALKAGGADWHDLAAHLGTSGPSVVYVDVSGMKTKPPRTTPPLFEDLRRSDRLAWLNHAVVADCLDQVEIALCIAMRAQVYSQPHKTVPPRHCAALSTALGKLWIAGIRV